MTEGIGIAAPMLRVRPPLWTFAALTLLAGGPAVPVSYTHLMFPLVPVLGVSLWRGDGAARAYGLPLALAGLAIATWHSGLYAGILPAPIVPCTKDGPSCTGEAQMILGLPIPYLSLVAFAAISACLAVTKGPKT